LIRFFYQKGTDLRKLLSLLGVCLLSLPIYSTERPLPGDGQKEVLDKCQNWANEAKDRGTHQLVVAFEGLAAFKKKAAKKLYSYHDALLAGKNPKTPSGTSMAYVTDNLLIKNLRKHYEKTNILVLPHTKEGKPGSISFSCVSEWKKVFGQELDLILVGHSFGGPAAKRLMNSLNKQFPKLKISGMLSMDPRLKNKFVTAPNVGKHFVYYQKGFLRGYPYSDPRGEGFTFNFHIKGKDISGSEGNNHANLTFYKGVQDTYLNLIH
tara:strand:- start:94807 stop:95601 length:795 start_codon:yes stop_codon:yes gene_type:complete